MGGVIMDGLKTFQRIYLKENLVLPFSITNLNYIKFVTWFFLYSNTRTWQRKVQVNIIRRLLNIEILIVNFLFNKITHISYLILFNFDLFLHFSLSYILYTTSHGPSIQGLYTRGYLLKTFPILSKKQPKTITGFYVQLT